MKIKYKFSLLCVPSKRNEKGMDFLMKFIFPQNYNFKNKLFGIFDYSTLFFNIIWEALVLLIVCILFKNWSFKIFVFIVFCFPLLLLSFVGFNGENIVYVLFYIFKFQVKQKLFFYNKS